MPNEDETMLRRGDAVERVRSLRERVLAAAPTERIPIDNIVGRTLAEPIVADVDQPDYDRATMDGFAFDATDDYPLTVVDEEIFPETDPPAIGQGEAIRIATGARLPERANVVLKREEANIGEDDRLRGVPITPGTYVYERGSNVREGERLFDAGERLSPKDAIFLRDLGIETVRVHERLSVAVLATGTEIHEGQQADLDSPMLAGLVRSWGHEATYEGTVPDDYDVIERKIEKLATEYDVVMTTGGTSVGQKDHVVRALGSLGTILFHRVRIRPGKPIAVARLSTLDAVAFAIPGKPIGAHTVTTLVARPFFTGDDRLPTVEATLDRDIGIGPEGFEYVVPVVLQDGTAMPLGHADSALRVYEDTFDPSVLSSSTRASRADGFLITETELSADERISIVPYPVVENG